MVTCPKCNASLVDGSKFCEECGAPIPAPTPTMPKSGAPAPSMSLGDKNVISGDIIQQKSTYNVQGNIVNETVSDETKLVNTCHVCGKHVANDQGFTCPKCHQFVCEKHYDMKARLCKACSDEEKQNRYTEYQNLFYELDKKGNGSIDIEARKQLDEAKAHLNLTDEEVKGLEYKLDQGLSRIELLEVQNALQALLTGDASEYIPKMEKIHNDHECHDYEQCDVLNQLLKFYDLPKYKKVNVRGIMWSFANIELAVIGRKFYDAEQQIFDYRRIYGDLSRSKGDILSSARTAIENAYLYSVMGSVYEKTELTERSAEYLRKALECLQSEDYQRYFEIYPNRKFLEKYWTGFIKFIECMNAAVTSGNKDVLSTLSPFWKFMAKPYKGFVVTDGKAVNTTDSAILGKKDADELKSLVEGWKMQVAARQQKLAAVKSSVEKTAAQLEEERRRQAEAEAAEDAKRKAILEAKAAKHDEEEREKQELLKAREAKIQARVDRDAEAQARKAAREQERAEAEERRRVKEAEKAAREAERIRKKELEASVQPFMVLGEYKFTYVDRFGVSAPHKVREVYVTDGRHFNCTELDEFFSQKTFLLENVHDIQHVESGKTADNALDLFRQFETKDVNAFSSDPFVQSSTGLVNPFENEAKSPVAPTSVVRNSSSPSQQMKDALEDLSASFNSLKNAVKKTQIPLGSDFAGEIVDTTEVDGKKRVNKWVYILLALSLGWFGIHKFYAGKKVKGVLYIIFFWTYIPLLISVIEAVIAFTKPTDENGNFLV